MPTYNIHNIEILPASTNPLFEERETGITHTAFEFEMALFQFIKLGDVKNVITSMENYLSSGLVVGRLSSNSLRQMQYWAVSCISVAIHYAILGGLDETEAFNLSDEYIRRVDQFSSIEMMIPYLQEKALDLTYLVYNSKFKETLSPVIRRCLHYIHLHLHNRITVATLAKECHLSCDYLSALFKKEMGMNVSRYIMKEKLKASEGMLSSNYSYDTICYQLAFCSEAHFITCFKKEYGITPGEYVKNKKMW